MFEQFTDQATQVVLLAQGESTRMGHNYVGSEQLLLGISAEDNSVAATVLKSLRLFRAFLQAQVEATIGRGSGAPSPELPFTPEVKRVLAQATEEAFQRQQSVGPEHLLLAITQNEQCMARRILENIRINIAKIREPLIKALDAAMVPANVRNSVPHKGAQQSVLSEFGTDLTELAAQEKLDPVVGRQAEIERVIQILGRRTKNNPLLLGEPGVGKTAIAEGLAQRIVTLDIPAHLQDMRVISLDLGLMVAGTSFRGEFEDRLSKLLAEVKQAGNIVLVIDEVHTLLGTGAIEEGMDAANLMKPALARGDLRCIGATTLDEYRQYIEQDAALERRFQSVSIGEPTVAETIEILQGIRPRYEDHHRLTMSDEALTAAAQLSARYIADRFLPDKAIDLIDEAGSRVRLRHTQQSPEHELKRALANVRDEKAIALQTQDFDAAGVARDQEIAIEAELRDLQLQAATNSNHNLPTVAADDIAQVVSAWTQIPVSRLTASESAQLLHLEEALHHQVIGQEQAVKSVARAIRRARIGLKSPHRPMGSFIFCGPTGVGKTELTKALANSVFGSTDAMVRLDMSEFMERQSVSKLIGSPPGYVGYGEGGQLTEAVRRNPYTIILLDEIEKAHPDVFNLLLQVLEDGRLTDSQGRVVNFQNTLIIMTSNLGAQVIQKSGSLGFNLLEVEEQEAEYLSIQAQVNTALKLFFRPEFLNRLDDVIVFQPLQRDEIKQIVDVMLRSLAEQLSEQNISLEVTAAVKDQLAVEGYDPSFGARPLRQAISRLVEDTLAEAILAGTLQSGDIAVVDQDDDGQIHVYPKPVAVMAQVCR